MEKDQEGDEGGVTFTAHIPVPSQKEVRQTNTHTFRVKRLPSRGETVVLPVCLSGGGSSGQEEEDGVTAALRQRDSSGSESSRQNSAGTLTR